MHMICMLLSLLRINQRDAHARHATAAATETYLGMGYVTAVRRQGICDEKQNEQHASEHMRLLLRSAKRQ
eukprot:4960814-Pyramimonas_sp.AAC.1